MGKRLYEIENIDVFKKLSSLSSYWLGFIAADGYISDKGNVVGIGLNKKDLQHLENFKSFLGSFHPIIYRKEVESTVIRITSKIVKDDIRKWLPTKSLKGAEDSMIKIIPDDFKRYFIAGYFDGDGSVFSYNKIGKYKDKIYNPIEQYVVSIVGNYNTISDINEFLQKYYNFNKLTIVKNDNVSRVAWTSKTDISEFFKLYISSPLQLERKLIKYNYIIDKLQNKNGRNGKRRN